MRRGQVTHLRGGDVPWGEKGGADEQEEKARQGASLTEWETFLSACLRYSFAGGLSSAREIAEDVGEGQHQPARGKEEGGRQNNKKNRYDGGGAGADTTKLEIRTREGGELGGATIAAFFWDGTSCHVSIIIKGTTARLCFTIIWRGSSSSSFAMRWWVFFFFFFLQKDLYIEKTQKLQRKRKIGQNTNVGKGCMEGATCTNILGGYFFLFGYMHGG